MVREALKADPEAARTIFWDHGCEPPLCAAVRLRCSAELVHLLLESGADHTAVNPEGKEPLMLLAERKSRDLAKMAFADFPALAGCGGYLPGLVNKNDSEDIVAVASVFARFGADPACQDAKGMTALDAAVAAGNEQLVLFWQKCQAMKVLAVLARSIESGRGSLALLPVDLVAKIAPFVGLCPAVN